MRRATVAGVVLAALLGGCGGAEPSAEPAPAAIKTPQQLAAEKLIAEYEATPGCGCTGELRAKERAATLFTYAGEGLVATSR